MQPKQPESQPTTPASTPQGIAAKPSTQEPALAMTEQHSSTKSRWKLWLVLWLSAIPLSVALGFTANALQKDTDVASTSTTDQSYECITGEGCYTQSTKNDSANLDSEPVSSKELAGRGALFITGVLSLYVFLGWIPLVISLVRKDRQYA